jgi:hypothetical protein
MLQGKFPAEWCFLTKLDPQVGLFPVPIFGVNNSLLVHLSDSDEDLEPVVSLG